MNQIDGDPSSWDPIEMKTAFLRKLVAYAKLCWAIRAPTEIQLRTTKIELNLYPKEVLVSLLAVHSVINRADWVV